MRLYIIAQGSSLGVFHAMVKHLLKHVQVEMLSFFISGSSFYRRFHAQIEKNDIEGEVLKGWEIVDKGLRRRPDTGEITAWEKRLGVPSLWPAIIADRRMIYGKECKVKQDYEPRYSFEELKGITIETVESLWTSLERMRPNIVLSFSPATIAGYISCLVAKALGIPVLTLKSTKISNFVTLSEDFSERHFHIRERYEQYARGGEIEPDLVKAAKNYISSARKKGATYEGVLIHQEQGFFESVVRLTASIPRAIAGDLMHHFGHFRHDPHYQRRIQSLWHHELGKWWRMKQAGNILSPITTSLGDISQIPYVFFPLNSEPEIALNVYSRFTLNQLEVIRNIAQSVPLGMYVVVKEHPRSWGLRSKGYYRRLTEIPNVLVVPVETPTTAVIQNARTTIVISSFVGFESLLLGVPVLTLGNCSYDILPESMVLKIRSFDDLPGKLEEAFIRKDFDENSLECFVAAVMRESVAIDLYSSMLGKGKRERGTNAVVISSLEEQYENMACYFFRRFHEVAKKVSSGGGSAKTTRLSCQN